MKAYVLIIEDRHADTEVEVYLDKDLAIEEAKRLASENGYRPRDYKEYILTSYMIDNRWVFYAEYSNGRDGVRVVERDVHTDTVSGRPVRLGDRA